MVENSFKVSMSHADSLYKAGKWEAAADAASAALEAANATGNEEYSAEALNRRAWSRRYIGLKSNDPDVIKQMYEKAQRDWREVLDISKNLEMRISAIKGLILLPAESVEEWCEIGLEQINRKRQELTNLEVDLINSKAIEIRKTDQVRAFNMFEEAYKIVQHGTVIAGHLKQNAGTCWLMLLKGEEELYQRILFVNRAIRNLEKALAEYPADQVEHRKSTQNKLDNIRKDLVQYQKEFDEEQEREKQKQTNK